MFETTSICLHLRKKTKFGLYITNNDEVVKERLNCNLKDGSLMFCFLRFCFIEFATEEQATGSLHSHPKH